MWKKVSAIVLPAILAGAIIAFMLVRVWDDLLLTLGHIHLLFLVPAVTVCLIAWLLRGWRYRFILRSMEIPAGFGFSTACIFISQTANLIIPARLGDLVRVFILRHRYHTAYARGISSLVVERFFDIMMVAVLGAVSLPSALLAPSWFTTTIAIPLAGGAIFLLVLILSGRLHSENRWAGILLGMLEDVRETSIRLQSLAVLAASSLVIWLVDVMVCATLLLMFDEPLNPAIVTLAIVIGNLVKAIPVTPGGMGTYEIAVALTLEIGGTAAAAATLVAVVDHLVKNLVTLAGGAVSFVHFGDWTVDAVKTAFHSKFDKVEYGGD
ncbi:MAG: lysylphosphatidylglycerol synthase transmembrane domain-containing protein [Methanoculleaceae archaeon]